MNTFPRLVATLVVWGAVTAIAMTAIIRLSGETGALVLVTAAATAGAAYTSSLLWRGAETENPAQTGKAKRAPGRVSRMLETLSEDEVCELRARLLQDEDETLADLMTNRQRSG